MYSLAFRTPHGTRLRAGKRHFDKERHVLWHISFGKSMVRRYHFLPTILTVPDCKMCYFDIAIAGSDHTDQQVFCMRGSTIRGWCNNLGTRWEHASKLRPTPRRRDQSGCTAQQPPSPSCMDDLHCQVACACWSCFGLNHFVTSINRLPETSMVGSNHTGFLSCSVSSWFSLHSSSA